MKLKIVNLRIGRTSTLKNYAEAETIKELIKVFNLFIIIIITDINNSKLLQYQTTV